MQLARLNVAAQPRLFGRGRRWQMEAAAAPAVSSLGTDLKLFATTFVAGFLFVSVLIG